MNYAISLLKHLSAWLIINGWLPVEDRQMRWTSHQIGFFSIPLIPLGCLPFCMQIVFDYGALYSPLLFLCVSHLDCTRSSRWEFLKITKMAAGDVKSHPVLHRLFLSPHPPPPLLFTYQYPTNPDLALTDCGARFCPRGVLGCQGARKCPDAFRDCQWKCSPPNQSLMGPMRHEFGYKKINTKTIHGFSTREL